MLQLHLFKSLVSCHNVEHRVIDAPIIPLTRTTRSLWAFSI